MHGPDETVEGEVEGNFMPGSLFNRTETRLRQIAQRDSGCRCSLHGKREKAFVVDSGEIEAEPAEIIRQEQDRKSTRLNSSHGYISYAVFCLKKKKKKYRSRLRQEPSSPCSLGGKGEGHDSLHVHP